MHTTNQKLGNEIIAWYKNNYQEPHFNRDAAIVISQTRIIMGLSLNTFGVILKLDGSTLSRWSNPAERAKRNHLDRKRGGSFPPMNSVCSAFESLASHLVGYHVVLPVADIITPTTTQAETTREPTTMDHLDDHQFALISKLISSPEAIDKLSAITSFLYE